MKQEAITYNPDITGLFSHFAEADKAILLDSGHPQQRQGRYDIFSAWPSIYTQIENSLITLTDTDKNNHHLTNRDSLIQLLNQRRRADSSLLPFTTGWMGFASYELGYLLEPAIYPRRRHQTNLPLFFAGYYPWAIVQDHQTQQAWLNYEEDINPALLKKIRSCMTAAANPAAFSLTQPFRQNLDFNEYEQRFQQIQNYLAAGDCYQVNLAMQYQTSYEGSPFTAYRKLRKAVPSPYMAYLNLGKQQILSISPERFLAASGSDVETRPIKGTSPRHANPEQDRQLAQALARSAKNRAENLMIVDLLRNDLGRFCTTGSVRTEELFAIESYENVHHMVSTIKGRLRPETNIWEMFFGCFPGGSITGAPKIRACQIIAELEPAPREIYCGSIFYASNHGRFDASIAIRTLLCEEGTIKAWAGGGIVRDSTAKGEYEECQNKIRRLLQALEDHS